MDKETQIDYEKEIVQLRNELHSAYKFFDFLPDPVVLINAEHKIMWVNREFLTLFGYSADFVRNKNAEILFPEKNNLLEYLAKGNIILPNQELRKKDKSSFWGEIHLNAYYDVQNQIKGYSFLIKDVTEQNNYKKELEFQAMLLDKIEDAITATDLEGNITYVNKAECRTFKKSHSELIGSNVTFYGDDPENGASQQDIIQQTLADGKWSGNIVNFTDKGRKIYYHTRTQLLNDEAGNPIGMVGVSTDITDRMNTLNELKESELLFKTLFQQSAIGFAQLTKNNDHIQVNKTYCEITGYSQAEFEELNFQDLTYQEDLEMEQKYINQSQKEKWEKKDFVKRIVHKDGRIIFVQVYVNIMRDKEKGVKYLLLGLIDITKQRADADRLLSMSTRLTLAVESADIGIWEFDIKNNILIWDDRMYQLYGIAKFQFSSDYEAWEKGIHPEDIEAANQAVQQAIAGEKDFDTAFRVIWTDGSIHFLRAFALVIRESGKASRMIGINYDITKVKLNESKLEHALAEKSTLLRELYHRTKNNMQVISAMLDLESMSNDDENVRRTFHEMGNRIQTMSMVHHKLYQSKNLSQIDLGNYLDELSQLLLQSNNPKDKKINIVTDLESIEVQIDSAIPCGLIINELISNSLKYAFKDRSEGEMQISLFKEENLIHLIYRDNGCGFPKGFDFDKDINLGLLLVKKLSTNQLQGQIRFDLEGGFGFEIRFEEEYFKGN
ncbi:MAG: PAS domain S-box protein [Candidatus Stygibacter frigidus]|nr:PAS domain S-box protein [Candidatus Stygibacter frigidus]